MPALPAAGLPPRHQRAGTSAQPGGRPEGKIMQLVPESAPDEAMRVPTHRSLPSRRAHGLR
jgi:hypothetical protein